MVDHTALPWSLTAGDLVRIIQHAPEGPVTVAGVHKIGRSHALAKANGELIVRAVNSYGDRLALAAALEPLQLIHRLVSDDHPGWAHRAFPLMDLEYDQRIRLSFGHIDDIVNALAMVTRHG